jgi:hypothetical protein
MDSPQAQHNIRRRNMDIFETKNRRLEQFIYVHKISHIRQYRDIENLNVWVYEDTPELRAVIEEYNQIIDRLRRNADAKPD